MGKNTEKKLKKADPSTEVKRPKDRPQELKDDSGIEKKRKKFRGKKKKADVKKVADVFPPKLNSLQSGNERISSNWKALQQDLSQRIASDVTRNKSFDTLNRSTDTTNVAQSGRPRLHKKQRSTKKQRDSSKHDTRPKTDVWFDDVDESLLENSPVTMSGTEPEKALVKQNSFSGLTKIIGMDCEMVGVGRNGDDSILARVSIVNHFGNMIYDSFVKPRESVTDYRTSVSGVRPKDLINAPDFKQVQEKVSEIMKGRILVGHAIHHDLKVLFLDHPRKMIRDTSKYKPFRAQFGGKTPGLKKLCERYIGVRVQTGEHSSVQDAQAAVRLYTLVRNDWEQAIKDKHQGGKGRAKGKAKPALNNKSQLLSGIQEDLSRTGTKLYVDSDSD